MRQVPLSSTSRAAGPGLMAAARLISLRDGGPLCPVGCSISSNGLSGWTFGGGVEYKFAPNWSAKVEYRHFDFGNFNEYLLVDPIFNRFIRFDRNITADAVTVWRQLLRRKRLYASEIGLRSLIRPAKRLAKASRFPFGDTSDRTCLRSALPHAADDGYGRQCRQ